VRLTHGTSSGGPTLRAIDTDGVEQAAAALIGGWPEDPAADVARRTRRTGARGCGSWPPLARAPRPRGAGARHHGHLRRRGRHLAVRCVGTGRRWVHVVLRGGGGAPRREPRDPPDPGAGWRGGGHRPGRRRVGGLRAATVNFILAIAVSVPPVSQRCQASRNSRGTISPDLGFTAVTPLGHAGPCAINHGGDPPTHRHHGTRPLSRSLSPAPASEVARPPGCDRGGVRADRVAHHAGRAGCGVSALPQRREHVGGDRRGDALISHGVAPPARPGVR
jgi:hypothetical protein